jgi:hypothetical protein
MAQRMRNAIRENTRKRSGVTALGVVILALGLLAAGQQQGAAINESKSAPVFAEVDAVRLMDEMCQALESNNRNRFLKLFDAKRMPGYTVFRDQVAEFFGRYNSFQTQYHVMQVARDGELGAMLATFEIDAGPSDGVTPNVRKNVSLRLITAWDGKQWRIVDLSPRSWLQ